MNGTPTFEDVAAAFNAATTAEKIREAMSLLRRVEDPKLDMFRAEVRTQFTSELIALMVDFERIVDRFRDDSIDVEVMKMIVSGAMIAIADEIDRRMPVPVT